MKTIEQVLQERYDDAYLLRPFLTPADWAKAGIKETAKSEEHNVLAYTEENVKNILKEALDYLAYKADNERGISTGFAYDDVSFWLYVLEVSDEDMTIQIDDTTFKGLVTYSEQVGMYFGWENLLDEYYKKDNERNLQSCRDAIVRIKKEQTEKYQANGSLTSFTIPVLGLEIPFEMGKEEKKDGSVKYGVVGHETYLINSYMEHVESFVSQKLKEDPEPFLDALRTTLKSGKVSNHIISMFTDYTVIPFIYGCEGDEEQKYLKEVYENKDTE